ncbi:hypothetical protein C8Q70DRAFT_904464 [Cubamyces menziesii]|uniref:Knr4/Smi1-like domain-containing protein n=1 Tax=Trametes cubensis TaxID=1111947 RepID=A0AAD7TVX7_9APHY|nr:hypothetical protein C8Q70DRAFT_904464 [Cubamyces menziesii]KAJ8482036.1 hypothetical protein ONZ51_g5599 [Trametes cubensis]
MSWLASLFSSSKNTRNSSRKAMTSTHEAFSLPTSSPSQSVHPDAFNPETLTTPGYGPSSSSYSYPPSSPSGPYYDVPPSATRSKPTSILPLHQPAGAGHPYPPLSSTWNRLRQWLSHEYPELGDTLNYGILPQDLAQIEMAFGFSLPAPVRESYLCVDGQEPESSAGCSIGLFFGLTLLPLEDVLEEWRFWREVDDDPATGANPALRELMQSIPPGWVRREYSCRGWIPLVADKAGNYLGIDMNPGEGGAVGQVIVFGRDFDTKVVMWRGDGPAGWAKFLAGFVEDLESGEGYELGPGADGSDGSEDDLGYNSYFFDGVGGGQGDTGGDAGTGGLRLAGEYKGWSVLEAWADRSVRRWIDAGIVPENIMQQHSPEKGKEKATLDPIQAGVASHVAGAEVPIPVLTETDPEKETSVLDESSLPTPLGNVTNFAQRQQQLPTISVTKPPAPLPVDLPSPSNLDSPSDFEDGSFPRQDDIEGNPAVQETESGAPLTAVPPRKVRSRSSSPQTTIDDVLTDSPPAIQPSVSVSPPVVPDLLVDAATLAGPSQPQPEVAATTKSEEDSPVLVEAADASSQDPDTTIRLVGGGGIAGTLDDALQADGVLVDEEDAVDAADTTITDAAADAAAEVASIRSVDSKASTSSKKHSKKKSISASLKKLGQLGGGKRRTDSVTSIDSKHSLHSLQS